MNNIDKDLEEFKFIGEIEAELRKAKIKSELVSRGDFFRGLANMLDGKGQQVFCSHSLEEASVIKVNEKTNGALKELYSLKKENKAKLENLKERKEFNGRETDLASSPLPF